MITQADSRKWMACLYNSFLFMEAKIMKMAKKLLAVVLTGVMAVSMLTGCASIASRQAADELEGMLHSVKGMSKASVTADDDTLAKDALKDTKDSDGKAITGFDARSRLIWTLRRTRASTSGTSACRLRMQRRLTRLLRFSAR